MSSPTDIGKLENTYGDSIEITLDKHNWTRITIGYYEHNRSILLDRAGIEWLQQMLAVTLAKMDQDAEDR